MLTAHGLDDPYVWHLQRLMAEEISNWPGNGAPIGDLQERLPRRDVVPPTSAFREKAMSSSETTTDHDTIREWIEKRGGVPTVVKGTEGEDGEGILRVDFGKRDDKLEEIPWEEFFQVFEDRGLAFLYQEETKDGSESRFFKFVKREG